MTRPAYSLRPMPLHPQFVWAVESGVLTWAEATALAALPPWETVRTVDDETAVVMRRHLWWLRTTDRAQ
jgi:hypothetical protein